METGFLMETKQQLSLLKSTGVYDNNSIDTVVKSDYFVSKDDFFKMKFSILITIFHPFAVWNIALAEIIFQNEVTC